MITVHSKNININIKHLTFTLFRKNKKLQRIRLKSFLPIKNMVKLMSIIKVISSVLMLSLRKLVFNEIVTILSLVSTESNKKIDFISSVLLKKYIKAKYLTFISNQSTISKSHAQKIGTNDFMLLLAFLRSLFFLNGYTKQLLGNPMDVNPTSLPINIKKFTVLRSPHTDKKSREQFKWLYYTYSLALTNCFNFMDIVNDYSILHDNISIVIKRAKVMRFNNNI